MELSYGILQVLAFCGRCNGPIPLICNANPPAKEHVYQILIFTQVTACTDGRTDSQLDLKIWVCEKEVPHEPTVDQFTMLQLNEIDYLNCAPPSALNVLSALLWSFFSPPLPHEINNIFTFWNFTLFIFLLTYNVFSRIFILQLPPIDKQNS